MKLVKCPRCDLNYITESEKYCKVCLREMRGTAPRDEVELCSICNENPVIPGKDVCLMCLKEMNEEQDTDAAEETMMNVDADTIGDLQDPSEMEELVPEIGDDEVSEKELNQMAEQLSLEDVRKSEESQEDDEEEDEET